jgi:hypothetical protein
MKYQYTATPYFNTKGRLTKRPIVEVELRGASRTLKGLGLIDSGADTTIMNIEYAKILGIPLDQSRTKEFIGIAADPMRCFIGSVSLKVQHVPTPVTTAVAFIDSPSVDILLGQEDFFEHFRIKFEKDHDTFELQLSKKAA